MTFSELEHLCKEAARDLTTRQPRPLPAAVVVPLAEATQIITLPGFPDDDPSRFDVLQAVARDRLRPLNAPAYGFLAEATLGAGDEQTDVVAVVFGARRRPARLSAAPLTDGGTGDFAESEELDPVAMPFLAPLQHAVDSSTSPDGGLPSLPN